MNIYKAGHTVQVGPHRFMAASEAARQGVKAWKRGMPAPAAARSATRAAAPMKASSAAFDAELARLRALPPARSIKEVAARLGCTVTDVLAVQAKHASQGKSATSSSVPPAPSTMPIPWQHYTRHEARAEHGRTTAWLSAIAGKSLSAAQRAQRDSLAERCRSLLQVF